MSPNSTRNCRHIPQGVEGSGVAVQTAIALNSRYPSAMARTTALLSAQIVAPYDAFSTFPIIAWNLCILTFFLYSHNSNLKSDYPERKLTPNGTILQTS